MVRAALPNEDERECRAAYFNERLFMISPRAGNGADLGSPAKGVDAAQEMFLSLASSC
jgi:hypothetical protein